MQLVVVSATRHALPVADAPAATTVLSREQIEMKAADNVLEALRGETGITVFGRTIAGRKALALRGLEPGLVSAGARARPGSVGSGKQGTKRSVGGGHQRVHACELTPPPGGSKRPAV